MLSAFQKTIIKILFYFFASLVFNLSSLSYGNHFDNYTEQLIDKCAKKIVDNRIYLKPGYVFLAQNDIILKIEEDMMPLKAVYCDKEGIYVYDYQLFYLIQCGICDMYYDPESQRSNCPHSPY